MVLAISVFAAAWLGQRRKPWKPRFVSWLAVGISATVAGILLGMAIDKMTYESFGFGGWLRWGSLLAAAVVAPPLSANAMMSGRSLPAFLELLGPRESRTSSLPSFALGVVAIAIVVIATGSALGSVFDPRWQDLPFAALTMAAVPLAALTWLNRPKAGSRPIAETMFAGLFFFSAGYIVFIEGTQNWQALWTSGAYMLLALTMYGVRSKEAIFQSQPLRS
jgi:glucan 1,3-beta-glucosidase